MVKRYQQLVRNVAYTRTNDERRAIMQELAAIEARMNRRELKLIGQG